MVKYNKAKRSVRKGSKMTKTAAKRKVSKAMLVRGGFVPNKPIRSVVNGLLTRAASDVARKAGGVTMEQAFRYAKNFKMPTSTELRQGAADLAIGVLTNTADGPADHNRSSLPFTSKDTQKLRSIGSTDQKQRAFKTTMTYGIPTSSTLKMLAKQHGTVNVGLTDTRYDSLLDEDSVFRSGLMELTHGFNQKGYSVIPNMHVSHGEIADLYSTALYSYPTDTSVYLYGGLCYLWQKLRILNTGSYFKTKVTIRMYSTVGNREPRDAITNAFSAVGELGIQPRIPLRYQLRAWEDDSININAMGDPERCRLELSALFRRHFNLQKSWTKTLAPGDYWDFMTKKYCGPGIRLDQVKNAIANDPETTVQSVIVIEHSGFPCEGIYQNSLNNVTSHVGLSPGWLNVEYSKGYEAVKAPLTIYQDSELGGGIVTSDQENLLVRAFKSDPMINSVNKMFNVSAAQVTDQLAPATMVIPVMSNTVRRYAGEIQNEVPST